MTHYIVFTMMLLSVHLAAYAFAILEGAEDMAGPDHALAVAVAALWSFGLALLLPI